MNDFFPEHAYPPIPSLRQDYELKVKTGIKLAKSYRVAILGMVRDCETVLPSVLKRLELFTCLFGSTNIFIYENDSIDKTKQILRDWNPRDVNYNINSSNLGLPKLGQGKDLARSQGMAMLRNNLRDWFLSDSRKFDYVIVLDMDLKTGWSLHGIANSFGWIGWDMMSSNGIVYDKDTVCKSRRLFYDTWALRFVHDASQRPNEQLNLLQFHRGEAPIKVWSNFGGLAIYTYKAFALGEAKYQPLSSRGLPECDHVSFNTALRENGFDKLYLNPSQICVY